VLLLVGCGTASAATTWVVRVGYDFDNYTWVSLDFFPSNLSINVGDTVQFLFTGAGHTVTFFPIIRSIFSDPFNLIFDSAFNPIPAIPGYNPFDPTSPFIQSGGSAVINNATGLYSSGIVVFYNRTWNATFTVPGTYGFFCLVHPLFLGSLTVLSAGTALPAGNTQANFDAQFTSSVASLSAALPGILTQANTQYPAGKFTTNPDGTRTFYGAVGYGSFPLRIHGPRFYPNHFDGLRKGDQIQFTLGDIAGHTIAFNASGIYNDADSVNSQGQLVGNSFFFRSFGDPTNWGGQFVSGGILLPFIPGQVTVQTFNITIGDITPGTYKFECNLHVAFGMSGTVTIVASSARVLQAASALLLAALLMLLAF